MPSTWKSDPVPWSIPSGKLPPGLSLNTATGVLSGTPTGAGNYPITVRVEDYTGSTAATKSMEIVVSATALGIGTANLPAGSVGASYTSTTLTGTGGIKPYSWRVAVGKLPPGLGLVGTTGVISGTPLGAGSYPVTIILEDAVGTTPVTKELTVTVSTASLNINTSSLTAASATVSYSATLAATGGVKPYVWSVSAGSLPPGIGLNTATGVLSGKPTAKGTYGFTLQVCDQQNPVAVTTKTLSITVN